MNVAVRTAYKPVLSLPLSPRYRTTLTGYDCERVAEWMDEWMDEARSGTSLR